LDFGAHAATRIADGQHHVRARGGVGMIGGVIGVAVILFLTRRSPRRKKEKQQ
jgi:hypothetical protein